jgi:hypothetical protein
MKPYFYLIKHKTSNMYYAGSQYGKNSNPNDLLKTYLTSSKKVKKIIENDGIDSFEIEYIDIRSDAREYEQKYLMEMYKKYGREKFLSIYLNRNLSPGILLTDEIIQKANEKRKISNSISAKKLFEDGRHNFQIKNAGTCEHVRKMRSERMKGNKLGSLRNMTDELKNKIANGAKGNTNVRGTKWWTNGLINKRSKECPGKEFVLGTTKNRKIE